MNFRTLNGIELARLVESGNQAATDYVLEHAHELLEGVEDQAENLIDSAYRSGHSDGVADGARDKKQNIRDQFQHRIERAMTDLLGKKTDPDQLDTEKAKLWDLFCELSRELEA